MSRVETVRNSDRDTSSTSTQGERMIKMNMLPGSASTQGILPLLLPGRGQGPPSTIRERSCGYHSRGLRNSMASNGSHVCLLHRDDLHPTSPYVLGRVETDRNLGRDTSTSVGLHQGKPGLATRVPLSFPACPHRTCCLQSPQLQRNILIKYLF